MKGWVDEYRAAESTLSQSPDKYKHSCVLILGAEITENCGAAWLNWSEDNFLGGD